MIDLVQKFVYFIVARNGFWIVLSQDSCTSRVSSVPFQDAPHIGQDLDNDYSRFINATAISSNLSNRKVLLLIQDQERSLSGFSSIRLFEYPCVQ